MHFAKFASVALAVFVSVVHILSGSKPRLLCHSTLYTVSRKKLQHYMLLCSMNLAMLAVVR